MKVEDMNVIPINYIVESRHQPDRMFKKVRGRSDGNTFGELRVASITIIRSDGQFIPKIDAGGFNNMYGIDPQDYSAVYKRPFAYDTLQQAIEAVANCAIE